MDNKMLRTAKKYVTFFSLSILFIIIVLSDQIIKNFLIAEPSRYNLIMIRDFFEIKRFFNYNLSLLNFIFFPATIYILVTLFVFIVFYKFIYSPLKTNKNIKILSLNIGAILIYGGALSNLIDRIRLGFVVDYFYLKWPVSTVFNIADIAILVGSIILIREIVKTKF